MELVTFFLVILGKKIVGFIMEKLEMGYFYQHQFQQAFLC